MSAASIRAAEPKLPAVSAAVQPYLDRGEFAAVVTLVGRGGEIVHLEALGDRDREAHDPLQVDDLFWIASMTKPITATALLILQDEGKLSVDDPVSKYVPEFADVKLASGTAPQQPVLIRHLLTHTAGLGQLDRRNPETRTLAEQSQLLAKIPLKWEPGSQWEYGVALQVVGRIIEVASGEPYEVFLQHRIFDPLGMTRTTFQLTPELKSRLATTYKLNEAKDALVPGEIRYVSADPTVKQTPMPSGGLFSCARDVHRFYATIAAGGESNGVRIVSAAAAKQMTSPQTGDLKAGFTPGCAWGLGWCLVREPQGITASLSPGSYGHGGAYGTQVWVDPTRGLVTVLMVQRSDIGNSDGSNLRKALHDAVATATTTAQARPAAPAGRPNVVLVMADDQGWGDTGYNGHPELKTPQLDALAAAGLRLDQFHTAHFNCSPTRASVMTGRHPHRMGTFSPGSPIRAQELTVAQVLQHAGYRTGHFGKWHLNGKNGDKETKTPPGRAILESDPLSPGRLGFDEWVSADNFFDLDPVLGRAGVPEKFHGESSDIVTNEALQFITATVQAGKPFFTVVWFGSPHVPHEALPADKAAYKSLPEATQNYYGELTAVDRSVGRLRATLRDLHVAENTLLWYCSDNGGAAGPKSTGGLRGSKGTLWEGGLRVPGLIEWSARIPQPFVSGVPCSTLDIYPTVLAATGAVAEKQIQPLDGVNLLPLIDRQTDRRDRAIPFWSHANRDNSHAAWLDWPFKLHVHASLGKSKKQEPAEVAAVLLYDVSKDPQETTDLAASQPERVAAMTAALTEWQASVRHSLGGGDYDAPLAVGGEGKPRPRKRAAQDAQ